MGYFKLIQSGKYIETYAYKYNFINRPFRRKKYKNRGRTREVTRRSDNVYRAKSRFVRLIRANLSRTKPPLLFTFTFINSIRIETAFALFSSFSRRFRIFYGKDVSYIAVPEFQKRGAIHFHALVWGLAHYDERSTRTVQNLWSYGYVDVIKTNGSDFLALYLAKYMSKSMQDKRLLGKKSYFASRNLLRPVSLAFSSALSFIKEIVGVDNYLLKDKVYDTLYLGSCHYKLYKLS